MKSSASSISVSYNAFRARRVNKFRSPARAQRPPHGTPDPLSLHGPPKARGGTGPAPRTPPCGAGTEWDGRGGAAAPGSASPGGGGAGWGRARRRRCLPESRSGSGGRGAGRARCITAPIGPGGRAGAAASQLLKRQLPGGGGSRPRCPATLQRVCRVLLSGCRSEPCPRACGCAAVRRDVDGMESWAGRN